MNRLTGLPQIAPDEQTLRQALLGSLNGVHVSGVTLRAKVLRGLSRESCWFRSVDGPYLAIEEWSGEAARFLLRDSVIAAEWLERAESLVAAIECALGIELEPADLVEDNMPPGCLILHIEGLAKGAVLHRILLAVPPDCRLRPTPAPFAPELLGDVAIEVDLVLEGPRLEPHEAADLTRGDLVLLGGSQLSARLHTRSRAPMEGLFNPRSRTFHPTPHDRSMP